MKKLLFVASIAMIGLVAISSCSKKSSGSGSSLTATVNGKQFTSSHCIFSNLGGDLTITGYNGSNAAGTYPIVTLAIYGFSASTPTYSFSDTSVSTLNIAGIDSSATVANASQTGSITIKSSSSTSVTGTFNFTCTDGTTVTNGSFTASNN